MNGKKRIARLRNAGKKLWWGLASAEKPKAVGIDGIMKNFEEVRAGIVARATRDDFNVIGVGKVLDRSKVWDPWKCEWVYNGHGPFDSGQNFIRRLEKRGFKTLGTGAYSTVLAKDGSDRVIKVTRNSQDNWIDYIQWAAQKGYCGNLAPKVYSWKKFTKKNTFSVAVVERMKEEVRRTKHDAGLIEHLLYPARSGSLLAKVYMEDLLPGCVKFFDELIAEFDANDIYGKNMMIRHDGTFCVTDPVSGHQKTSANRLRTKDFTSLAPAIREILIESCYRH